MSSRSSAVGGGDRDRLLAGALHVEAGLALALGAVHAVVEHAHRDHVASGSCAACRGRASGPTGRPPCRHRRARGRGAWSAGEVSAAATVGRGAARCPRRGLERGEVGRIAGAESGLGHMQREHGRVAANWVFVAHLRRPLRAGLGRRQVSLSRTFTLALKASAPQSGCHAILERFGPRRRQSRPFSGAGMPAPGETLASALILCRCYLAAAAAVAATGRGLRGKSPPSRGRPAIHSAPTGIAIGSGATRR